MILFFGQEINPHDPLTNGEPVFARQRTHFFGVPGTSEIFGGDVSTPWSVTGWIVGSSAQAVAEELETWVSLIGSNLEIVETGFINRTIDDCTLDSVTPSPEGIRPFIGEGSALSIAAGSFYVECKWEWTQLGVGWT